MSAATGDADTASAQMDDGEQETGAVMHRVTRMWTRTCGWGKAAGALWLIAAALLAWDSADPRWMVGRWGIFVCALALYASFRRYIVEVFDLGVKVERATSDAGADAVGTFDFDPSRRR